MERAGRARTVANRSGTALTGAARTGLLTALSYCVGPARCVGSMGGISSVPAPRRRRWCVALRCVRRWWILGLARPAGGRGGAGVSVRSITPAAGDTRHRRGGGTSTVTQSRGGGRPVPSTWHPAHTNRPAAHGGGRLQGLWQYLYCSGL